MNKPIKAKNLPLFSIIDLDQLRREKHLEGTEVTDFFTARDGKVYLLMEQPSETQGKDWLSTPSTYTAVEIQLDWAEQRVLETTLFPLGLLKFQFHYLRPAGDHFLLLGARCAYRENGPDQNAWIVSRDGAVLSRFCLGDGIQDCVVKKDGTIITSYFDEGVFGNYGWDEPLGACGLIAWTSEGTPLWKNENYSIYDCYAISLDEEENLWFYYYDELLAGLEKQGLSLPTADEWAYLCGSGCRTLFPWGDGMDYSMHLHHFESPEDEDKPFDMEEPNFFGVSIAYDPYMREVVKAEQFTTCGGDGGRGICGGLGIFLGFLPCSPHCKPEVQEDKELNGDYDFYRPIIRVDVN